jgi:hypothetical protein
MRAHAAISAMIEEECEVVRLVPTAHRASNGVSVVADENP